MIWTEILVASAIALVLAVIFVPLVGWRRPGMSREKQASAFWFFFLVLFLATWAGGAWIAPMGPLLWGVPWLSFLLVGLVVALLLAAVAPPRSRTHSHHSVHSSTGGEAAISAGLGLFFWLLMLLLLFATVAAYTFAGADWRAAG